MPRYVQISGALVPKCRYDLLVLVMVNLSLLLGKPKAMTLMCSVLNLSTFVKDFGIVAFAFFPKNKYKLHGVFFACRANITSFEAETAVSRLDWSTQMSVRSEWQSASKSASAMSLAH